MPCVFCGASDQKMSNEHLWPQWIRRLLPPDVQKRVIRYSVDTDAGRIRSFDTRLFELKVKDVCKSCNEGWMSLYESDVQHFATGMLQGNARQLHRGGQTAIAAWAVLKCLVGQRLYPNRKIIPEDHYRALYELRREKRPPDGAQVFTARASWSNGKAQPGFFRINGAGRLDTSGDDQERLDGYLATLSVLNLVVQVFWPYDSEPGHFVERPERLLPCIRQIWPTGASFVWPPGPGLTTCPGRTRCPGRWFCPVGLRVFALQIGWFGGLDAATCGAPGGVPVRCRVAARGAGVAG
jgi:hypothetical protein